MRRIVAAVFQSLDGVIQAPGGRTEDWTGGFAHGGWLPPHFDDTVGEAVGGVFAEPFALLLGRRTWEIFAAHWPYVEGEEAAMGTMLTQADKYVLTRGGTPLGEWANSHKLDGIDAVAALKATPGPDLLIQGSSTLYPPLLAAGLIDRLTTLTFPVVLGHGKRLFGPGTPPLALRLTGHAVSATGVVVAHYETAGAVPIGGFELPEPSARERARQERMRAEDAR